MTSSKLHLNDLASLDIKSFADNGCWLVINHPVTDQPLTDAKGNQWRMLLAGKDSAVYRKATSEAIQRRFNDQSKVTPDLIENEQIQVLKACVLNFEHFVMSGEPLLYSEDNASMVVERFPWLREQIERVILDRERYFLANTPA